MALDIETSETLTDNVDPDGDVNLEVVARRRHVTRVESSISLHHSVEVQSTVGLCHVTWKRDSNPLPP